MGYIGKVPADVLIDPMVDSAAITDATIVTADIADDAITSAKLAANSVDSSELIDGSVDNSHLAGSIAVNKTLLAGGTGLTLSTNTLNVDAAQTQITSVGTLTSLTVSGETTFSGFLNDAKIYNHLKFVGSDGTTVHGGVRGASNSVEIRTGASTTVACTFDGSQNASFAGKVNVNTSSQVGLEVTNTASNDNYVIFRKSTYGGGNMGLTLIGNRNTATGDACAINFQNTQSSQDDNLAKIISNHTSSTAGYGNLRFLTYKGSTANSALTIDEDGKSTFNVSLAGGYVANFQNVPDDTTAYGILVQCGQQAGSGTTIFFRANEADGDATGYLRTVNGTFELDDTSDIRLKKDVVDTTVEGLSCVNAMKVRDFTLKKNNVRVSAGFIANELIDVFPPSAHGDPDAVESYDAEYDEDGNVTKEAGERIVPMTVSRERLVPVLVKAIQELSAEVEKLKGN